MTIHTVKNVQDLPQKITLSPSVGKRMNNNVSLEEIKTAFKTISLKKRMVKKIVINHVKILQLQHLPQD